MTQSLTSLRTIIVMGLASTFLVTGCNKLGYGEPRTAPVGHNAILGPKRLPQLNNTELSNQKQSINIPANPHQPMPQFSNNYNSTTPMMMQPQAPQPVMMPMSLPQMAPQTQMPQQTTDNSAQNPYANGSQSYTPQPAPVQNTAPIQQTAPQQQSYQMPTYDYAPNSYHQSAVGGINPNQAMAQTVSATDYYTSDMRNNALGQSPQIVEAHGWQQSAPVAQVYGQQMPQQMGHINVSGIQNVNAGYAMEAAYGRYPDATSQHPQVPQQAGGYYQPQAAQQQAPQQQNYQQPQQSSGYQPMSAAESALFSKADPYAKSLNEPEYNNVFYGGNGMPQGQGRNFQPDYNAAGQSGSFTNGFQQRASGMLNPVSSESYIDVPPAEVIRRPLEEPPMLVREAEGNHNLQGGQNALPDYYYQDDNYR